MAHLIHATRREYQKIGKLIVEEHEAASRFGGGMGRDWPERRWPKTSALLRGRERLAEPGISRARGARRHSTSTLGQSRFRSRLIALACELRLASKA